MKHVISFLKTTIVGGALYLIPIVVIVVVLGKLHAALSGLLIPLAETLPLPTIAGFEPVRILALAVLLLACFIAGLFSRTDAARRFIAWLESSILSNLPGYSMVSALAHDVAGETHPGTAMQPVLARIEDAWQLAMRVERVNEELFAVFVPGAPDPKSGSVYLLTEDRLKPVDILPRDAMKCLKGMGIGARELLAGRI